MTTIKLMVLCSIKLLGLLIICLFIGCQDLTTSNREFEIPPVPTVTDDSLQVSSLAEQGIDPDEIARFAWEIRNGDFDEIHTLGLDAGLIFNIALGKKWVFNLRSGVFRTFTRPVQAYFAGTA